MAVPGRGKRQRAADITPIEWKSNQEVPRRNGVALWDFSGPTSVKASAPPASSSRELRRAELFEQFRVFYAGVCAEVLGLEKPPSDSIDRWLLEQLAQPRSAQATRGSRDPLLPYPRLAESSNVLRRELLAEVPMRCHSRVTGKLAEEQLVRYLGRAREWLMKLHEPVDSALSREVKALGEWLKEHDGSWKGGRRSAEECLFRRKLDGLVTETAGEVGLSVRFRVAVEDKAVEILKRVSDEAECVAEQVMAFQAAGDAEVALEEASEGARRFAILRFGQDAIPISWMHLQKLGSLVVKLRSLYEVHNGPADTNKDWEPMFRQRLYCMLRRYVTFIGLDPSKEGQGGNMHAAAPESVFAWLRQEMGVSCELFASPLNCYFAEFYSAFPDVDSAFGSRGSFFEVAELPEGSYEVGPPYTEEVMDLMAKKLLTLLRGSGAQPLSFVVFVPDWGDACTALGLMSGEDFKPFRHCRHGGSFVLARGREHEYISGVQFFQHSGADASRRYYDVPHGTRIYVLQNPAGAAKWPFTEEKERALLAKLAPAAQHKKCP